MSFSSLKRILPKAIEDAGISRQVHAARVLALATEMIQTLWGEERARYVQVISFKEGLLKLSASSPVAVQELRIWEARLQNEINRRLGQKIVQGLLIQG